MVIRYLCMGWKGTGLIMKSQTTREEVISRHEREARMLYVIAETDQPTIKVGVTRSMRTLHSRLRNLQTGNPRILITALLLEFTEDYHAYHIEQEVLHWFRGHRILDSEWLLGVSWQEVLSDVQLSQSRPFSVVLPKEPNDE